MGTVIYPSPSPFPPDKKTKQNKNKKQKKKKKGHDFPLLDVPPPRPEKWVLRA